MVIKSIFVDLEGFSIGLSNFFEVDRDKIVPEEIGERPFNGNLIARQPIGTVVHVTNTESMK